MARQQLVIGTLAAAGLAFAAACDSSESLYAPRTPALGAASGLRKESLTVTGPGPMTTAIAANVCADVWEASRTPGAPVAAYGCHGGANQQFALQPSGAITAYDGALCLDVWQAKANDGDPVVVYTCHGGANQKWSRSAAGELRTAVNGKCLDVFTPKSGKYTSGAKLVVMTCRGTNGQKWTVRDAGTGIVIAAPVQSVDTTMPVVTPIVASTATTATTAAAAELPRAYLDTRIPTPTGRTISVAAGGDLQAALNAAAPGDVVVLPAGATFVGNYVLPAKGGASGGAWITVRTAGTLPAEGARVSPADAGQMPKILTPNAAPAIQAAPYAQGWRFVGIEVSATGATTMTYNLVNLGTVGADQSTDVQVPSRLVIDRSYIHGTPTLDLRRCLTLNSASTAVVDSYVTECHSRNGDSQAIGGWNGPGPFKIVNNRLEGAHENIAFGGADPSVPGLIPSDIEIRQNYVVKPAAWKGVWPLKNLVEVKAGQRILIEGNVFENNWVDAQNGFAFLFWSANADGGALWSITQDVTFRYNRVKNVAGGFSLGDRYRDNAAGLALPKARRMTIQHVVVSGLNDPSLGGNGRAFQITGTVQGVTIANVTAPASNNDILFATPAEPLTDLVMRDNVLAGEYHLFASGVGTGAQALTGLRVPSANVTGNVFATRSGPAVPVNAYAASVSDVGFSSLAGGDLRLTTSSPYRTRGTGGSTPGADIDKIDQMTAGIVR